MNESKKKESGHTLKKDLNPISVWSLAFGCIIGWGAFFNPGLKFLPTAGTLGTSIAMLIGAAIMIIIACSYNYLIPKYPVAGGEFAYARAAFGANHAYICGWFLVLAYIANVPMNATTLGYMTRFLFDGLFQFGRMYSVAGFDVYFGEVLISVVAVVLLSIFSVRGVKVAGVFETIFSVSLAVSVVIIAVVALFSPYTHFEDLKPYFAPTAQSTGDAVKGVIALLAIAPWAFVGFDTIPQACEEFNFSHKKVFGIMVTAIIFGAFVYISNNLVAATAMNENYADVIGDQSISWLLGYSVRNMLGWPGLIILSIALTCAILTGLLGFLTATSRLMYSMALNGYLPEFFAHLHTKHRTPDHALWFCMIVSLIGPFFGRVALGWFVDMSAIGAALGYAYTCVAAAKFAGRDRDVPNWRAVRVTGWIGGAFAVMFLVMFLPGMPAALPLPSAIMLLVWIAFGVVFHAKRRRRGSIK